MTKSKSQEYEISFEMEDVEQPIPPEDIVAYNELRSCADLARLHATGKLEIQPDFQREFVWKQDDQSRFIDSLVKQLPIPSMCFSLDYKTQKWKVIDGLQRMSTITKFLSTAEWKLSDLSDIHPKLRRARNIELKNGDDFQKKLYAMVEDVSIPITVIRCDYNQASHMRYLFTIFHRLNSGGVRLTNQEIRNCIYSGPFNDILKEFDQQNNDWRSVKRRIWGSMDRYRSIEILLRILAFGDNHEKYDGNLAGFLNDYMNMKSKLIADDLGGLSNTLSTIARVARRIFNSENHKLSLSLVEAILVALYVHSSKLDEKTDDSLLASYASLKAGAAFNEGARYAISSSENVRARLNAAISAFS